MVIRLVNGAPERSSISELRRLHPQVSFPSSPANELMAEYGFYRVTREPEPDAGEGQVAEQSQTPVEVAPGDWRLQWTVRDLTQEELDERLAAKRRGMKVSMRQARLALLQQGLLSQVETAIASMDEPARSAVQIEWEYAHVVDRTSPWIGEMSVALGLTDKQMDGLFELAATL